MRRIDSENKVFGIVLLWLALASVAIGGGWQVYAGAGVLGQTTLLYEDWVRSSPILDAELTVSYSHFSMESGVRFVRYSYSDTVKLFGSSRATLSKKTVTIPACWTPSTAGPRFILRSKAFLFFSSTAKPASTMISLPRSHASGRPASICSSTCGNWMPPKKLTG